MSKVRKNYPAKFKYYEGEGESEMNLELMRLIDEQHLKTPFYGARQMRLHLIRKGYKVGRKRIRRLMRVMSIKAIYQEPRTSKTNRQHKVYAYLLRNLDINRPNQVWCADITYIPIKQGFLYLVAVMDWYSRKVLSWRLSNSLDSGLCVGALNDALAKYPVPEIFNTDQGSQFTCLDFTDTLKANSIRISMDGKRCWKDNVIIERFWKLLKYECVYLQAFSNGIMAKTGITKWLKFYNQDRPHSHFGLTTPSEAYTIYSHAKDTTPTATLTFT